MIQFQVFAGTRYGALIFKQFCTARSLSSLSWTNTYLMSATVLSLLYVGVIQGFFSVRIGGEADDDKENEVDSRLNFSYGGKRSQYLPKLFHESKRSFWETFPSVKRGALHEKDRLSHEHYELVYRSKSFSYTFYAQLIAMSVLAVQLYYSVYFVLAVWFDMSPELLKSVGPYKIVYDFAGLCVLSLFTVQNILMFIAAKKSVLRIYYNEDKNVYVLIQTTLNPFRTQGVLCKPGELQELPSSLVSSIFGGYSLMGKRARINVNDFFSMEHYNRLVGYIN